MSELKTVSRKSFRIAFSGGPCAGKTSIKNSIIDLLSPNFVVSFLPEVGELTSKAGINIYGYYHTPESAYNFLVRQTKMQIDLEDYFLSFVPHGPKDQIVISDRGAIDFWAWVSEDQKINSLKERNLSERQIRDDRYDLVIELVSSAVGASNSYFANGEYRQEDLSGAIDLELIMGKNWQPHPNFIVINNDGGDFEAKKQLIFKTILNELGATVGPLGKRYLVEFDQELVKNWENVKLNHFHENIQIWDDPQNGQKSMLLEMVG